MQSASDTAFTSDISIAVGYFLVICRLVVLVMVVLLAVVASTPCSPEQSKIDL